MNSPFDRAGRLTYQVATWGSHRYGQCTILQSNLTYRGLPLDFEQFKSLTDRYLLLSNNTKLARDDCAGSITIPALGIPQEIVLSLRDIHFMGIEKREAPFASIEATDGF